MKHFSLKERQRRPKVTGFTLLELLVVMGIIVFLVTMSVTLVSSSITTAREKNTKALIRKIDGLLSQRLVAFDKGLKSQGLTNTNDAAKIVAKKNLFRKGFPQNLAEVQAVDDGSLLADYDDSKNIPETESSEALYLCLTKMESIGATTEGEDAFKDGEIADTDGDGLMEFVDGWGRPLRFYRWPTRLIRPAPAGQESDPQTLAGTAPDQYYQFPLDPEFAGFNAAGLDASRFFGTVQPMPTGGTSRKAAKAQPSISDELNTNDPLAKDPDDPSGRLIDATRATPAQISDFENNFHTPDTWSTPLIVSAGKDGIFGLYNVTQTTERGHLAQPNHSELQGALDNITNRNLQP